MSYKNRTQRILSNLNIQQNIVVVKPKIVKYNVNELPSETNTKPDLTDCSMEYEDCKDRHLNSVTSSSIITGELEDPNENTQYLAGKTDQVVLVNFKDKALICDSGLREDITDATCIPKGKSPSPSSTSSCSSTSSSSSGTSTSSDSERDPYETDDSIKDPPYYKDSDDELSSENEENKQETEKKRKPDLSPPEKKGKKRTRNQGKWQKNVAKRLRNSGDSYIGLKTENTEDGKKKRIKIERPKKALQPPCGEKCKLKCSQKIKESDRSQIFKEYWGLKDLEKQRQYISSNMQTVTPRYKYSNAAAPRNPNNAYYFIINEQNVRVCKQYFMATLSINNRVIQTVLKKQKACQSGKIVESDKRGKHNNHYKVDEEIKSEIREHIKSIPRIDSHYCRSHSSKEYVEGSKTLADLHRDYLDVCKEKGLPPANYYMYRKIFEEEFNIAFYMPKKDQCELCLQFKNNTDENNQSILEKYETHIVEKDLSRIEKDGDKTSEEYTKVVIFDMQAVLPCPVGDASSFYYVSKLNVLNFTFYDLKDHVGTCFMWHEAEGQRGANEIGTCIFMYLKNLRALCPDDELNIIFYSDNCAGQNKNKFLLALYAYAISNLNIKSITHKFFITGHSQNENDSVHATIEKAIKKNKKSSPIYIPETYAAIIRSAKKTGTPYKVNEICHQDIFDLRRLAADLFLSLPKNIKVTEFRVIKLDRDYPTDLFFKNSFAETEFTQTQIISTRKNIDIKNVGIKMAYNKKPEISAAKKNGLLSLIEKKKCVPMYYLDFYKNL